MTGKQLKNSILQWAIQGKLVPQDPNDEPASVLLERIREEKARLIKEKKIKKDKNESIIYRGDDNSHYEKILATGEVKCIDDEIPFEIPKSWEWVRMNELGIYRKGPFGSSLTKSMFVPQSVNAIKVYEQKNAIQKDYKLGEYFISQEKFKSMRSFIVQPNDIIVSCAGTIGETYLLPKEAPIGIINQALMRVCLYHLPMADFWQMYFDYILVKESKMKGSGSAIKNIPPFEYLKAILVPIPPKEEQKRIVACYSRILQYIEKYEDLKNRKEELNNNIYPLLRKAILQEAIQGRLVEQCKTEGSASKLLERIREEKQRLIKQGKLKAKDLVDSVIFKGDDNKYYEKCGIKVTCIDNEVSFTIPESWQWARLGELITTKTGLAYSKPNLEIKSNKMVRVLRGGNITNGSWQMKADDVMISSEFVKPELYLRKGYFITPAVTSWENMGKTALVRESYEDVVVGGFVLMMCPFYIDGIFEEYLNHFFQSTLFQQYCRSITNKSGQAFYNLSRNKLLQLLVPIPPVKEQQRIYHKLNDALASIMSR